MTLEIGLTYCDSDKHDVTIIAVSPRDPSRFVGFAVREGDEQHGTYEEYYADGRYWGSFGVAKDDRWDLRL